MIDYWEKGRDYDIGMVCVTNLNLGNNLTNYALYQCLRDLHYRVLLINRSSNPEKPFPKIEDARYGLFLQSPYSSHEGIPIGREDKWQLSYAGLMCDKFILGSDQLWRDMFLQDYDFFTCLDWAGSQKYKMAYATSFGVGSFEGDTAMREKMGYLLKRFQTISVREPDGVKILRQLFGIEAECVLDPVFLCAKKYYECMADKGRDCLPEKRYVGAYLLDITDKKGQVVRDIADAATDGEHMAMTEPGALAGSDIGLQIFYDPAVEEWLAMIENCDFFITDSFHGLCFALIFQKQFCVLFDEENWRGISRIRSLLGLLHLDSRLIMDYDKGKITGLQTEKINYDKVNAIISRECEKSKNWLEASIRRGDDYEGQYDTHDYAWRLCSNLEKKIQELKRETDRMQERLHRTRNELFLFSHDFCAGAAQKAGGWQSPVQVVGWGAGECFKRNIERIKRFYNMKYVCDVDPEKWGKEMQGHVTCISPETLAEMNHVLVIIMVDRGSVAMQIADNLLRMGITNFKHVENWLSFVEG